MFEFVVDVDNFLYLGKYWDVIKVEYDILFSELEYVVWMVVWGFCVNYFMVSVNYLICIDEFIDVNILLKEVGFVLNILGGEIKGGLDVFLV